MCLYIFLYFNDIQSSILITNFFCCGRPCTKSNYTILSKELPLFLKCSTTAQKLQINYILFVVCTSKIKLFKLKIHEKRVEIILCVIFNTSTHYNKSCTYIRYYLGIQIDPLKNMYSKSNLNVLMNNLSKKKQSQLSSVLNHDTIRRCKTRKSVIINGIKNQ